MATRWTGNKLFFMGGLRYREVVRRLVFVREETLIGCDTNRNQLHILLMLSFILVQSQIQRFGFRFDPADGSLDKDIDN